MFLKVMTVAIRATRLPRAVCHRDIYRCSAVSLHTANFTKLIAAQTLERLVLSMEMIYALCPPYCGSPWRTEHAQSLDEKCHGVCFPAGLRTIR
jgi:hypothetical protein